MLFLLPNAAPYWLQLTNAWMESTAIANAATLGAWAQLARGELPHDLMGREVELPKSPTSDLKPFELLTVFYDVLPVVIDSRWHPR
jgi:hypothetical protein